MIGNLKTRLTYVQAVGEDANGERDRRREMSGNNSKSWRMRGGLVSGQMSFLQLPTWSNFPVAGT